MGAPFMVGQSVVAFPYIHGKDRMNQFQSFRGNGDKAEGTTNCEMISREEVTLSRENGFR